jgi:hypothetical protein
MHMKDYPLTWLKSKQNSKVDIEGNPIDVPADIISRLSEYKKRHTQKQLEKNVQPI